LTSSRVVGVPIEHIDAELLAAPFASRNAFAKSLVSLDPRLKGATVPLWREAERDLLVRFPGMSVDDLLARRDHIWFDQPQRLPTPVSLDEVVRNAALLVVTADAGVVCLVRRHERGEIEQRRMWRWISFSLPPDLLLASIGAPSERLTHLSHSLRNRLAGDGLAETHLHLKAALSFSDLWTSLMSVLADIKTKSTMLESPGADWNEGRDLAPVLLQCALARQLIGAFLARRRASGESFMQYVELIAWPGLVDTLGTLQAAVVWRAIVDLSHGKPSTLRDFVTQRHAYALLIGHGQSPRTAAAVDPMAYWFPAQTDAPPDYRLARTAFAYLSEEGRGDALFARIFWQTVRGRVAFYRHIVQRPMVPGLQWFIRAYGRLSEPRRMITLSAFVNNARKMSGAGLRSLEVRLTPDDRFCGLRKKVLQIDQASRGAPEEIGVVFHFSRERGDASVKGRPEAWGRGGHDDPSARDCNPSGYRFAGYYRSQRQGAIALANLLLAYPRSLEIVRGIDLCTDELGVPLWVVRPLLAYAARAGKRASALLARHGSPVQPLGTTVHAGEDFVHLLGGIRRVAEAVEVLDLGEGARLGHAVALGIDVQGWTARTGFLRVPRGERLLDLLWAWRVAPRLPDPCRTWLPVVEQHLARIAAEVFGRSVPPATLTDWWAALHDNGCLRRVGFPDGPARLGDAVGDHSERGEALRLMHAWLTNSQVFQNSQQLETIDVREEAGMTQTLQDHVRRIVGDRSIVVEVNPSSNLLIGHLVDLTAHPLWRLAPPAGSDSGAPPVRVTIGSDDPITFATTLPDEYQLVADTLSAAGVTGPQVDLWLSAAQRCGLMGRFTVARSDVPIQQPTCFGPPEPL
jgi:hypothetical protein